MQGLIQSRLQMLVLIPILILTACGGAAQSSSAPAAIESYLNALVARDSARLIGLSCAAWEKDARQELDSFAAVKAELKNPGCKISGQSGLQTFVSCTGQIVANYNGEDQAIQLSERAFIAVQEGGEWRMCGYKGN
jgi:hypothetical protein